MNTADLGRQTWILRNAKSVFQAGGRWLLPEFNRAYAVRVPLTDLNVLGIRVEAKATIPCAGFASGEGAANVLCGCNGLLGRLDDEQSTQLDLPLAWLLLLCVSSRLERVL